MGWNGSDIQKDGAKKESPKAPARPSPRRGLLIVLLAVAALAALVAWFVTGDSDGRSRTPAAPRSPAQIAEQKPAVVTNRPPKKAEKESAAPAVVTNFVNGVWYDPEGRPHYKPARTIVVGSKTIINGKPYVPPRQLFSHPSEVEMDRILSCQPGERIIGETNWKLFERDFPAALVDSIEIDPQDTEDEIARKNAVKEAKSNLAQAIKNGEDAVTIMKEAQQDMNRLADLYDNLNVEIAEAKMKGEMGDDEIELYVEAANKMLEKNQIFGKKILSPRMIRERIQAAQALRTKVE